MSGNRDRLKTTFDRVADSYHRARPEYPDALYDQLVVAAGLRPGDRLLEVGCGMGKATIPLARRGFAITWVEAGPALARQVRRNLAGLGLVQVVTDAFETWRPPAGTTFDLVFAATSWHWVDPAVRYQRAWAALRPSGHLAFWSALHVVPEDGDPFIAELQDVYAEIGEGLPAGTWLPRPGELPDLRDEITGSGLFGDARIWHFDWAVSYTAEDYIRLLDTFSGHIAMTERQRDRLYGEIRRRLARRPGGQLRRHWGAALHVAVRAETPT
jgi:SAM-dependent methyltransferase